ncbi:MAG: 1-acyl-sn-glycerol-3-phosphate acyltransferase [Bacteroidales bacterium]
MILPKHFLFFPALFRFYSKWMIRWHFDRHVIENNKPTDTSTPMLVLCNHISWWDGFWILNINRILWKKRFHVMMNEENLGKNRVLSYTGAFSVAQGEIKRSLQLCLDLLKKKDTLLLIFPQGHFESISNRNIEFKRGAEYILKRADQSIEVVFVANFIDYYAKKKPTLYSYCEPVENLGNSIEEAYREFYNSCLTKQIERALR